MLAISNQIGKSIDSQQVLLDIGYDAECEPPARITSLVNDYLEYADYLIDTSYSYAIKHVFFAQDASVAIEGWITFESKIIAQLLRQCEKVAIFAVTIGNRLEDMACRLAENGSVLHARVLDAIGSRAAEKFVQLVQDSIAEEASAEGLCVSRRFSPGYCDWEVDQQRMLFQAIEGDSAGIELTDGYLMIPRKSLSGIIGLGSCSSDVEKYNPCNSCTQLDCPGRR
jgi:hypothetical protein